MIRPPLLPIKYTRGCGAWGNNAAVDVIRKFPLVFWRLQFMIYNNLMNAKRRSGEVLPSTIFTGDNLPVLRGMQSESIDLIYLDPPFNSNRYYSAPIGSEAAGASFKDAWNLNDVDLAWHGEIAEGNYALYKVIEATRESHGDGMASYLMYIAVRLIEIRRLLKDTGSLYLHCDATASHYLKLVMDSIFGKGNFRNEIVWRKYGGRKNNAKKKFTTQNDIVLFYVKTDQAVFNPVFIPHSDKEIAQKYNHTDQEGRRYRLTWGRNYQLKGIQEKIYLDESKGRAIGNLWVEDGLQLNTSSQERTGYPTQKPLALLRRIIGASSNEGDTILDPFCGCATACVAAQETKRNWIGIDISLLAYHLIKNRFEKELKLYSPKIIHRTDVPMLQGDRSKDIRNILYGKQGGNCWGCGIHFHPQNLTVDHMVPKAQGGADTDDNLQLLCAHCNSVKGNRTMAELIADLKKKGYPTRESQRGYKR